MCSRFVTIPACDRQTDRRTGGIAVASRALAMRALRRARCNEVSEGAGRCWSYLVQVLRGAGETGCRFKSDSSTWFTRGGCVTSCRAGQPLSARRRSLLHSVRRQTLDADCRLRRTRPGLGRYHCTSIDKWSKYRRNAIRSLTFSSFRQVAPICTPIEYIVPYPYTDSASQTASRSVQPFLHSSRQRVPILYNEPPFRPQNSPFA